MAKQRCRKLVRVVENYEIQAEIEAYLREKGIQAAVLHSGRQGEFKLTFPFDTGEESETVTVGKTYKRIVSSAYRTAKKRAAAGRSSVCAGPAKRSSCF